MLSFLRRWSRVMLGLFFPVDVEPYERERISLSPAQEAGKRRMRLMLERAMKEVGQDAREAKRRGIPLHDLERNWRRRDTPHE